MSIGTSDDDERKELRRDAAITDDEVRDIAAATRAHEKTVLRRLVGLPVRGRVAKDVDDALIARGLRPGGGGGRLARACAEDACSERGRP